MSHIFSWITTLPSDHRSQSTDSHFKQSQARRNRESPPTETTNKNHGYNFTAERLKGSNNSAPDALSRSPVSDPAPHDILAELDILNQPDISISEIRAISATDHTSLHLDTLRKTAQNDIEYQQL